MPLSVEQFTEQLTSSGLMSEEPLREVFTGLPADSAARTDGEALARELVRQKKLTKFQAEQIYAGKGKALTLGNYVILDKLGQGGMGMVLKAEHKRLKRLVALKVMSPTAVKTPDSLKRFHREVEAAAKLRHPNVVATDDADEAKGTHFLVMEYVDGSDLSALVKKRGPLPVEQAVQCIIQAARGLEYAHEQGVIHRDIKPANLLIDAKGTVKILDMGLARIDGAVGGSSEGAGLTSTGTIMGTVDYMSPEQAMDTKHADARSDIYSLGCSLYYLLTGKVVYDGDTMMKKLMAHQNAPIPSLGSPVAPRQDSRTSLDVGLSADGRTGDARSAFVSRSDTDTLNAIDVVFRRMVAKRPEDRQQSMTEVIAELERCQSGGSPTIVYSSQSTPGSGDALQQFLKEMSGDAPASATSGSPASKTAKPNSQTAVAEESGLAETMISSAGEAGTDPLTAQSLNIEQSERLRLSKAGEGNRKKPRTAILVSVASVVVVLLGIVFVVLGKSGTLHLEITDELIEVTVGDTGRKAKGKKEHSLRVPLGEHVLHVQREDLAFDTDSFEMTKGKPVEIKVERVGNRIRVMLGGEFFAATELPRSKASNTTNVSGDANSITTAPRYSLEFVDDKSSQVVQLEGLKVDVTRPFTVEGYLTLKRWEGRSALGIIYIGGVRLGHGGLSAKFQDKAGKYWDTSVSTDTRPFVNRRIHLAAVRSETKLKLFLDGRLVDSKDLPDNLAQSDVPFSDVKVGYGLMGTIDQLRFSKSARYEKDFTPQARMTPDQETQALYLFDEGKGDLLTDSSGNNHHGKIAGAKWVKVGGASSPVWRPTAQQQAFLEAVAKLSAEEQVEAVKKKLSEVNPGFAPAKSTARIEAGKVVSTIFDLGELGTEVWPLRAWPNLESCHFSGRQLRDLSPLAGLKWKELRLISTDVVDLTPISGMPLATLWVKGNVKLSDLSPLTGMPLTTLSLWSCSEVFDLKPLARMPLVSLDCQSTKVFDLSPLAELPLTHLECGSSRVSDLSPLKGMSLTSLGFSLTEVRDLSPLKGMSLTTLFLNSTEVRDLSPLTGMLLQRLAIAGTAVSDLTPLTGMPLTELSCEGTKVTDLGPLVGSPIRSLWFKGTSVSNLAPLAGLPLTHVNLDVSLFHEPDEKWMRSLPMKQYGSGFDHTSEKFWQAYTARKQAAEEFATATAKLPADEQVTAIARRFQELKQTAVGFKPTVSDGAIVEAALTINDKVVDITPLRALTGLKKLTINGGPHWLDLSPLNSTPLESLTCRELIARRNAHILKAMPKLTKIDARPEPKTAITSVWQPTTEQQAFFDAVAKLPAEEQVKAVVKRLQEINPGYDGVEKHTVTEGVVVSLGLNSPKITNIWPVRSLPGLRHFHPSMITLENFTDLAPLEGMRLTSLNIMATQVTDLSPLRGMPLRSLDCSYGPVFDLTPLLECQDLVTLNADATSAGPETVAKLQHALPNCIIRWRDPADATRPAPARTRFQSGIARAHQEAWAKHLGVPVEKEITLPGGEKLSMILIPPGEFLMGSTAEQQAKYLEIETAAKHKWAIDRIPSEGPQHRVRITRPFYLGKYEVTQAQWRSVMASTPSSSTSDPLHPVLQVSWNNIQQFLEKVNQGTAGGKNAFSLPTEAQWEYACRAGSTTTYAFGENETDLALYGWFNGNSKGMVHPVGQLQPNSFGLYDMNGNAWEWCADWKEDGYYEKSPLDDPPGPPLGSKRALRGGALHDGVRNCRASFRNGWSPEAAPPNVGFRVAASVDAVRQLMTSDSGISKSVTSPITPQSAIAPFDAAQARAHQEAWAKHLGTTAETTNSVGAKMLLIPPRRFLNGQRAGRD